MQSCTTNGAVQVNPNTDAGGGAATQSAFVALFLAFSAALVALF